MTTNAASNDEWVGIDDINISGTSNTCTAPTNQPTLLSLTPAVNSISGSFAAADAGTTAADGYLVLASTSGTLTQQPFSGTTYTAGSTLGNATVVSSGSSTSFTAGSLTAGTTYYFFVYSFSSTGTCYNTASPLTGSIATNGAPTVSVTAGTGAAEPSTNGTFTFTLSSAAPAGGVSVNYTLSGTATQNSDYTDPQNGTLTLAEGATTATLTLTTLNDATPEAGETIVLTINTVSNSFAVGTPSATINLSDDNDVASISFTGSYTQDFNTLAASGTSSTLPTGWAFSESGTNANLTYSSSDGTTTSGNTYSLGTGTDADRALGGLRSGSLVPTIGALFVNNTGATISSLTISYTGEQWRLGATNRTDRLDFQLGTNATSLATGTWAEVDALDFNAPNAAGTTGAMDGNATNNRRTITYTLSGLTIANGASFAIRWSDLDATSSDDALGVDDFSIALGCTAPTNQPTALNFTPALTSISGTFTAAAAGTNAADGYLVVMSPSATLTEQPASGTTYALDDAIGGGLVVAVGNTTSFTATNLTPATTYYFFVYSMTTATGCYNITAPLTGSSATTAPPPCTPPATGATALTASNITGTAMDLAWTRGSGSNVLLVARSGSAVSSSPYNGVSYAAGAEIGTGNFVLYNGPASSFSYTGLTQNTTYHFALYEYNSADNCYTASPLAGNFTTACTAPVDVTAFSGTAGTAQVALTWTNPANAACFSEVVVVASTTPITGTGDTYTGAANAVYSGGAQVVYRGTGSNVTVTALTNGTTYYFKAFTRNSTWSAGIQATATPFDPATGYQYLFGNLHAHSSYSDGNKDNLTKTPKDDYEFARDAQCMDFLGISEHNHAGAGMAYADYAKGYAEANLVNGVGGTSGNSIVTLWGMEWGVISGGGHVLVYGFDDKLVGWESGNHDIYVAKNDYTSLWNTVNGQTGALATLAHPNSSDFGGIVSAYNTTADNAIVGVAVESGPAFSTSLTYNDYPSSLSYLSYYKNMLARGYHLAPQMDQDNHNMTFGTANANRMVVLSTGKSRDALLEGIRSMRYYASQDCNVRVSYTAGTLPMGSSLVQAGLPLLNLAVTDPDASETVSSIQLWGGEAGNGSAPSAPLKTYNDVSSATFSSSDAENTQPDNTTWYYYAVITQGDGNKVVTAPIWYSRNDATMVSTPVTFTQFRAQYVAASNTVALAWATAQESNSSHFVVERSLDGGRTWNALGNVAAAGSSNTTRHYAFTDAAPAKGVNLYRLRQVDIDGSQAYSRTASVTIGKSDAVYYTVYPNPAKGFSYVQSTATEAAAVSIIISDAQGRVLEQRAGVVSANAPLKLDLSRYTAGTYLVRIAGANGSNTQKVIVY